MTNNRKIRRKLAIRQQEVIFDFFNGYLMNTGLTTRSNFLKRFRNWAYHAYHESHQEELAYIAKTPYILPACNLSVALLEFNRSLEGFSVVNRFLV